MFGFFGVIFLGVIWEGLHFALWLLSTLATFAQILFWGIRCRYDELVHKVCAHPWVRRVAGLP